MNAPMVIQQPSTAISAAEIRDHVNVIQSVMQAVMKKDTHYGVIPGSKKPSLYKPGAETLCKTFHIAPTFQVEDISATDYYRYRVKCVGVHQGSGVTLGEGVGACSSNEEKYKWRRAICTEEFDAAPEGRRRVKFSKYQGSVEKTQQIRAEPDDIDNTVLKMACKRALVAMTLNVLAASDIFAQDIEDLPEHLRDADPDAGGNEQEGRDIGPTAYPADSFKTNLPTWASLITSGKKTAEQIIALVSSKAVLSAEQKTVILAVKQQSGPMVVTFAQVEEKIRTAADVDLLDAAADLIGEVAYPGQRTELKALYQIRKAGYENA